MPNNPARVLCVCSTLERGGAENMVMNLYRTIDRSKIQFDFVEHTTRKCAFEEEIHALGGYIFRAPRFHLYNYFQYRNWWFQHLQQHPEHQVIHGHFFTISSVYFKFAHEFKRITVGHSHASELSLLKHLLNRQIDTLADYHLACGEAAGKCFYRKGKFTVLNNGIDIEKFRYDPEIAGQKRKELNLNNNFVIGVVGSLRQVKNPFGTIEIFREILKRQPNARLVWAGDGAMRGPLEQKIHAYGLQDRILLLGCCPNVNDMLKAMDIYIMPSFSEGLPVSLIEAQAAGLPCFCSDAITREADITGLCHFLPLGNYDHWAETILKQDISHRKDTSGQIAQAGYDVRGTAKWLENFYLDIVAKHQREV